ncbi:oligosaccharide flippase family protein [Emticicia sp. ODNR4P]|nr:oligosaccharide flippase family protein [Emticicia sp. ODNR4P]
MNNIRKIYFSVFFTNIVTFASVVFAYFAYSKFLTPSEFGVYSVALALNNFGTLFLETGTRNAIIKTQVEGNENSLKGGITFYILSFSILLIFVFLMGKVFIGRIYPAIINDYSWICSFLSIFWISSAFIVVPTSFLEKNLQYSKITWVESLSVVLERAVPVLFMSFFSYKLMAFTVLAFISRFLKLIVLNVYSSSCIFSKKKDFINAKRILKESVWIQFSMSSSFIRDNLHVLIIGPLYGKLWVGYYAWGMQLATLTSQVFVQVFSRLSVSISARYSSFEDRWKLVQNQVIYLSYITTPALTVTLMLIPYVNELFFHGKWNETIIILPFLFARMIPSISTTPIAALLLVDKDVKIYAQFLWAWTIIEVICCLLFVYIGSAHGLAWSLSISAWFGVWLLTYYHNISFFSVLKMLIFSNVFVVSLAFYGLFCLINVFITMNLTSTVLTCLFFIGFAYLSDYKLLLGLLNFLGLNSIITVFNKLFNFNINTKN